MRYSPSTSAPPWMLRAFSEIGQAEVIDGENARIIEYHSATNLSAKEDEVPWCSSFVCWCLEREGIKSTRSAWAKSYLTFGIKLQLPCEGAICVFQRGPKSGHVGFYVHEDENWIFVLGGNQDNTVRIKNYPKSALLAIRYPLRDSMA